MLGWMTLHCRALNLFYAMGLLAVWRSQGNPSQNNVFECIKYYAVLKTKPMGHRDARDTQVGLPPVTEQRLLQPLVWG